MQKTHQFTAVIEREEDMYVALCPELDIASQGESVEIRSISLRSGRGTVIVESPIFLCIMM